MTQSDPDFRSRCSIARSLEILGDKWTLLVVRDLMWHGKHTFQALAGSEEHVPTNILAARLKRLEAQGLICKTPYQKRPLRHRYDLTDFGRSLEPVLLELMDWGHGHLGGGHFDPVSGESAPARA